MTTCLSYNQKVHLKNIIAITDSMDSLDSSSPEFELTYCRLDRAISNLDLWVAIDSPIPKLYPQFDSRNRHQCRSLASQLLENNNQY